MPSTSQYFRANAGILVVNHQGKVLVLQRADVPGAWQLPQGGIDEGEEPDTAALRELGEETGIDPSAVTLVAEYPEWLTYELPEKLRNQKTGRGQTQRWFVFRFDGDDSAIELRQYKQEFSSFDWVTPTDVVKLAADFRAGVYKKLVDFLSHQNLP
jgi:putative (di)nucleoside polyphosphate hydrolase